MYSNIALSHHFFFKKFCKDIIFLQLFDYKLAWPKFLFKYFKYGSQLNLTTVIYGYKIGKQEVDKTNNVNTLWR